MPGNNTIETDQIADGACSMCGQRGALQMIEGLPVCYDCIRNSGMFERCTVCGQWKVVERVVMTADGHKVCRDCATPRTRGLETWATLGKVEAIGVEVECFPTNRTGDRSIWRAVERNEATTMFTLAHDGSVTGGEELVGAAVPLVSAPEYFARLAWMARELKVDQTCGLHVHVNAKQYIQTAPGAENRATMTEIGVVFQRMILAGLKLESFMYDCQPRSRRTGSYAMALNTIIGSRTYGDIRAMKPADVVKLWYTRGRSVGPRHTREIPTAKYHNSRYTWINLHSLMVKNTVEFRLHSGTTNPMKMRIWSSICAKLVKHFMTASLEEIDAFKVEDLKLILSKVEWDYLAARKEKFGAPPAPIDESRMNLAGGVTRSGTDAYNGMAGGY